LMVIKNVDRKTSDQYSFIGTRLAKVDTIEKIKGKAVYTIDIQRPGMMTAVVAHTPRFGAKLLSFDATETRKIPGIVDVVEIPRGVAVLAKNFHTARRGRDSLITQWDYSPAEMRSCR